MRKWGAPPIVAALVVGLVVVGCEPPPRGPAEVMPTTGPNQVVIKVPGMT